MKKMEGEKVRGRGRKVKLRCIGSVNEELAYRPDLHITVTLLPEMCFV
jgi:hypothetical protein